MKYFNLILVTLSLLFSCKKEKSTYPIIDLSQNTIVVNPFKVAPLTAIVQITDTNAKPENIEEIYIKVLGKDDEFGNPGIDISNTLYPHTEDFKAHFFDITKDTVYNDVVITSKNNIEIPVLGLYPNYENKVFIRLKAAGMICSDTVTIKTEGLPDDGLSVDIIECHPKLMTQGDVTWMTADEYKYDVMFDIRGEIRWIIDVEGESDLRILENGNLLIRSWWAEGNFGEYTILGELVNQWKLPDEFLNHHDIIELPGGNFLVPVTYDKKRREGYITLEDNIIELDRESGVIINNWDLFELMDIANLEKVWRNQQVWFKDRFLEEGPGDWFHMNSICYDELRDQIIVSGKHGGVIKLSRNGENGSDVNANKEIIWYMPMHDQYTIYANHNATKDFILTAVDPSGIPYEDQTLRHDDFHWMKFQHQPTITYSKRNFVQFLIFNNVYDNERSAIVEYLVNEKKATVKEVWQYGRDRKVLFSPSWAGVTLLPFTDNRLMITTSPEKPKVEVTKNKKIAFEYLIVSQNFQPKWYRGGRINLYPDSKVNKRIRHNYLKIIIYVLILLILLYGIRKVTLLFSSQKDY